MNKVNKLTIILLCILLPSCVASGSEPNPKTKKKFNNERQTADCKLRKIAFELTQEQTGSRVPEIIAGCKGEYENLVVSETRYKQISDGAVASIPNEVLTLGLQSEKQFQQLILRGVPFDVALKLIHTEEFQAAKDEISLEGFV